MIPSVIVSADSSDFVTVLWTVNQLACRENSVLFSLTRAQGLPNALNAYPSTDHSVNAINITKAECLIYRSLHCAAPRHVTHYLDARTYTDIPLPTGAGA